jgi:hypothetical protein
MQESSIFDLIPDRDGLVWQVILTKYLGPAQQRADKLVWQVRMHAEAKVNGAVLADSGTLCRRADSRLLDILGKESIILKSGEIRFEAIEEKQIPRSAVEAVAGLRKTLLSCVVKDIKARAVTRQVEDLCSFS